MFKGAEKSIMYVKLNGKTPSATSGATSKQIDPGGDPADRQSTLDADSWAFSPARPVAPGPFAMPVTVLKLRPRSFKSKAARYCAPSQSPLGVPESWNVSWLVPVWLKVNVTPLKIADPWAAGAARAAKATALTANRDLIDILPSPYFTNGREMRPVAALVCK